MAIRAIHRSDRAHTTTRITKHMPSSLGVVPTSGTWGLDYSTAATTSNVVIRVEDVVSKILKIATASCTVARIRPLNMWVYANIPSETESYVPAFAAQFSDPISGAEGQRVEARGSLTEPARVKHTFSEANRMHWFDWDGVAGTSAELAIITTSSKYDVSVFVEAAVVIGKPIEPSTIPYSEVSKMKLSESQIGTSREGYMMVNIEGESTPAHSEE